MTSEQFCKSTDSMEKAQHKRFELFTMYQLRNSDPFLSWDDYKVIPVQFFI